MVKDINIEEDCFPPKTVDGAIDYFMTCASQNDMDLVIEVPKSRIPWLARNLNSLLTDILKENYSLKQSLGNKNMTDDEALDSLTAEIWQYFHSDG